MENLERKDAGETAASTGAEFVLRKDGNLLDGQSMREKPLFASCPFPRKWEEM